MKMNRFPCVRRQKGQVLLISVIAMLIVVMAIFLLFDVHTVIRGKVKLQNAVDSAAIVGANWQMNTLNLLGELNMVKACTVLISDDMFGIGEDPETYLAVQNRKEEEAAIQDRDDRLQLASDTLSQMQQRILFICPLIGFGAAQQAAKNNGANFNASYGQALQEQLMMLAGQGDRAALYAPYSTEDYAQKNLFSYSWHTPYLNLLSSILEEGKENCKGIAVMCNGQILGAPYIYTEGHPSADFASPLSRKRIYEAASNNYWCWLIDFLKRDFSVNGTKWWGELRLGVSKNFHKESEFLPVDAEIRESTSSVYKALNDTWLDPILKENPQYGKKLGEYYDDNDVIYETVSVADQDSKKEKTKEEEQKKKEQKKKEESSSDAADDNSEPIPFSIKDYDDDGNPYIKTISISKKENCSKCVLRYKVEEDVTNLILKKKENNREIIVIMSTTPAQDGEPDDQGYRSKDISSIINENGEISEGTYYLYVNLNGTIIAGDSEIKITYNDPNKEETKEEAKEETKEEKPAVRMEERVKTDETHDNRIRILPALDWAWYGDKWSDYSDSLSSIWGNYLRAPFRAHAKYHSGAVSRMDAYMRTVTISGYKGIERKNSDYLGDAVAENAGTDSLISIGEKISSAEQRMRNFSSRIYAYAVAKPFGWLTVNSEQKPPHLSRIVLPVFRQSALIPAALENPGLNPLADYEWYQFLLRYLPALGEVSSLAELPPALRSEFSYYDGIIANKFSSPEWRENGLNWLSSNSDRVKSRDPETGEVLEYYTNEELCTWRSSSSSGSSWPSSLH